MASIPKNERRISTSKTIRTGLRGYIGSNRDKRRIVVFGQAHRFPKSVGKPLAYRTAPQAAVAGFPLNAKTNIARTKPGISALGVSEFQLCSLCRYVVLQLLRPILLPPRQRNIRRFLSVLGLKDPFNCLERGRIMIASRSERCDQTDITSTQVKVSLPIS